MYLYTVISFDIPLIKYILEYGRNKVEDGGWGWGDITTLKDFKSKVLCELDV